MNDTIAIARPANPLLGMFAKPEQVGPPKCLLIYGEPKTRKTSIAGAAIKLPRFTKMLYVDIDNGSEVFVNDPVVHSAIGEDFGEEGEKRINIFPIDKTSPDAFGMLKYLFGYRDERGTVVPGVAFSLGYDIIIIDALDVAQEVAVNWLLANTFNDKGVLNTMKAWGEVSIWTSDLAWALQNAPGVTGIIVMHSKNEVEETGKAKIKPKLQGSVKDSIAGIPSLVAYLEFKEDKATKETHLVATLGASAGVTSGNRYSIDEPIVDFDLEKLYAIIDSKSPKPAAPAAPVAPPAAKAKPATKTPESTPAAAAA